MLWMPPVGRPRAPRGTVRAAAEWVSPSCAEMIQPTRDNSRQRKMRTNVNLRMISPRRVGLCIPLRMRLRKTCHNTQREANKKREADEEASRQRAEDARLERERKEVWPILGK